MAAGVTSAGLEIKTLEQILTDIEEDQLANIDPELDTSPTQPLGQINGIMAKKLAELWEVAQVCYNAFNRGAAEGVLLQNIGALTATPIKQATKGTVTLTCNLNNGTTLTTSATANVAGVPTNQWKLREAYTATSTGNVDLVFEAATAGLITANAGTITTITTPVSGWNSVTNAEDADPGEEDETEAEYRLRQVEEIAAPGASTVDALRATILEIDGVQQVRIFENTSEATVSGRPPKSFEVVIWDGAGEDADDDEMAQAIWDEKPTGVTAYGSVTGTAIDASLAERSVSFSRCTEFEVGINCTLQVDDDFTGTSSVKNAIAAAGVDFRIGQDVILNKIRSIIMTVAGVMDITSLTIGEAGGALAASNISITQTQIATFDTADMTVATTVYSDPT